MFPILIAAAVGAGAKELLIHRELAKLPPPRYQTNLHAQAKAHKLPPPAPREQRDIS